MWKEKYADKNKKVFPVGVYFDEFEPGNCLGSYSGERKLGRIYVFLVCLPPHLASKMKNIFISTICHVKYLKSFGNEKIFSKRNLIYNFFFHNAIS